MVWSPQTRNATEAIMHVLGLYNLALAIGVAGACSVCAPASTHDRVGAADRPGAFQAAGGYWAAIGSGATAPRRLYFPATPRDPAPRPDRRDPPK